MNKGMRILTVLLAALLSAGAVMAHGYGGYYPRSSVQFGVYVGSPWVYPAYPRYPAPVYWPPVYVAPPAPVVITQPPPVYVEQAPPVRQSTLESGYWYYCAQSQAYYPYVKECPAGWQKVSPAPAK